MHFILIILLLLTCITNVANSKCIKNKDLVAVVQIFRHGQRTPYAFYANDPYFDKSYWAGIGPGELTEEGSRQQYALGQFTRIRYQDWLPEKYDAKDFIARTTNYRRTKLSALSNINGLYSKDRQHIPLYLTDPNILFENISIIFQCNSYLAETQKVKLSKKWLEINMRFSNVYEYLTKKSGNNVTNLFYVHDIADSLDIENDAGLPLPQWTNKVYPEPLRELEKYYFHFHSHSIRQQRLSIGTWLNEVLTYLEGMADDPTSFQKFQMYSAHDFNIYSILNVFGAYSPPFHLGYASSLYIELIQDGANYYINVWLKNNNDFRQINIKNCNFNCPLTKVRSLLRDVIIDVTSKSIECNLDTPEWNLKN